MQNDFGSRVSIPRSGFCFVERYGGDWALLASSVSIPRSGFCFVEPPSTRVMRQYSRSVSIPRSGFCFVELGVNCPSKLGNACFNPSVGILFCRTTRAMCRPRRRGCFNPSVGILFCRTNSPSFRPIASGEFQSLGRDSVLSNVEFISIMLI